MALVQWCSGVTFVVLLDSFSADTRYAMDLACYFSVNNIPALPFIVSHPSLFHQRTCRICILRVLRLPLMTPDRSILAYRWNVSSVPDHTWFKELACSVRSHHSIDIMMKGSLAVEILQACKLRKPCNTPVQKWSLASLSTKTVDDCRMEHQVPKVKGYPKPLVNIK